MVKTGDHLPTWQPAGYTHIAAAVMLYITVQDKRRPEGWGEPGSPKFTQVWSKMWPPNHLGQWPFPAPFSVV